jgi:hypothetical protein
VPPFAYGAIDDELEIVYGHMTIETLDLLAPFLSFMDSITTTCAHNMLALMMDRGSKG